MPASIVFRSSLSLAVLAVSASLASAQERSALPSQVIVRALAGPGQPVTDLKVEEISIKTDGRERKVQSLELVKVAGAAPAATAAPAAAPGKPASNLPAPYSTNSAPEPSAVPAGGREFLIILDEEGIGAGREEPVRKAIAQITAAAAPSDRFGMISLRQGGFDIQASAPAALTDPLAKFVGGGSQRETLDDMTCRSKRALSTLSNALRASSAGRTILLISPGLPASPSGVQTMRADATLADLCQIRSNDFDELSGAAMASPANVYVLHYMDGMANTANVREAQQGLENITGTINGELLRLPGSAESIGRILSETNSYYIATLDPGAPGPVRRIDARSTREGTRLLVRPAGRVRAATTAAAMPAKPGTPKDMIRVMTGYREIPLRSTGLVSRVPGKTDLMVVALFEPEDPATKLNAAIVALYDEKGTLKAQWTAQPKELEVLPVMAAVPVAPGTYRMRVAVTDAAGKAGTTDTNNLVVQLKDAGPVKLGSLVLGVDQKSQRLEFKSSDPQVIGFLPLYGVTKEMKISVAYEVRESETGAPLGTAAGNIVEMPGAPDTRMVWGGFGLGPLAAGDYLMKVIVTVDGQEAGVVTRTLRKVQ